jgi:carbonic anhydrase
MSGLHYASAEVFSKLIAGHARFQRGESVVSYYTSAVTLAKGQHPTTCVLACADSRVPPEIVFDQKVGEMFVVRVAGNFADEDNQASLEYAIQHFHPAPAIILVLGHERCGAIQAAAITYDKEHVDPKAVEEFGKHAAPSARLQGLAQRLKPAIEKTRPTGKLVSASDFAERIDAAVKQNVRDMVQILQSNPVIAAAQGTFVVGARYDLDTGEIDWLTPTPK